MMSNKWTFSLTSLIAILTLAFVAPAAMAATFDVALDTTNDISDAAGLQLEYPTDNKLKVKVIFDEAVVLPAANISIAGFDKDGVYIPTVARDGDLPTDAKSEIDLTIKITGDTYRVALMIAKGIASADFVNKETSAELSADIWVYKSVTGLAPAVYGIRRNPDSPLALTGGAVNLVVTLSEMPSSFTAAHINVKSNNATVSSVTPLDRVPQNKVDFSAFSTHVDLKPFKVRTPTEIRNGLDRNSDADYEETGEAGIEQYLSVDWKDKVPSKFIVEVRALKKAMKEATEGAANGVSGVTVGPDVEISYYYDNKDGLQQPAAMIEYEATTETNEDPAANVIDNDPTGDENDEKGMPIGEDKHPYKDKIVPPSTQGTHNITVTIGDQTATIPKEEFDRSKKAKDYTRPQIADYPLAADYNFAKARYDALTMAPTAEETARTNNAGDQRAAYLKEKAIYDKYMDLQNALEADDRVQEEDRQKKVVDRVITGTDTAIPENVLPPTGRDGMLHPYLVSLMPAYANANDIVVRVNQWASEEKNVRMSGDTTVPNVYHPPALETGYRDGFNSLTIGVSTGAVKTVPVVSPTDVIRIVFPEGFVFRAASPGFTVVAIDPDAAGIDIPGGSLPAVGHTGGVLDSARTAAQMKYDVASYPAMRVANPKLPPFPNLRTFLLNGGTIQITGPPIAGSSPLVISEVMWGTDLSLNPHTKSQWIEVKNVLGTTLTSTAAAPLIIDFISANGPMAPAAGTVVYDSVRVSDNTGRSWIQGQGGRSGVNEAATAVAPVAGQVSLVSMQRVFNDPATQLNPVDGTKPAGWAASKRPSVNFDTTLVGERVGSPGDDPVNPPPAPVKAVPPARPETPVAKAGDIKITEIMVDTSSDRFPQWIELTYTGTGKVSLKGWSMVIDNAIDGNVVGGGNAITVKLDGVELDVSADTRNTGKGQSVLVVAWASARKSAKIRSSGVLNVGPQLGEKGRYQLLSYEGFRITLVPAGEGAIAVDRDIAGNLDEDWDIMMLEGPKRSSMIRREMSTAGVALKGTDAAGWILASATNLIVGPETYYGNDEDAGTPGYDAGGPLPVELSHFRPARDKATGQVVITWATQSELNNAGFYIKRSNQRHGEFKVINPTLIPGAGTTSEKQFYTYTDTTAQPNVVYYYQIEDVSLDGNHQTLTRGIRLKGHIGAAGKATTLWGELKSSNE